MSGLAHKCPLDPDRGRGALVTITGLRNVNILNQDHTGSDTGQESRVHFLKNATGRQVRRLPFYGASVFNVYNILKKMTKFKK